MKKFNLLFVTAHPDDESLWIGGTLNALIQFEFFNIHLICMTGAGDEERSRDFKSVMKKIGLTNWTLLDSELPKKGGIPLVNTIENFEKGLTNLGLGLSDIDVLITHSPYGDEHRHIQHRQLFSDLYQFSLQRNVPFGWFSLMATPYFKLSPMLWHARRENGLHLLNFARCEAFSNPPTNVPLPNYFLEFKVDESSKRALLESYSSINQEEHLQGYAAWDSYIECFYFYGDRSIVPFGLMCEQMNIPANGTACFKLLGNS